MSFLVSTSVCQPYAASEAWHPLDAPCFAGFATRTFYPTAGPFRSNYISYFNNNELFMDAAMKEALAATPVAVSAEVMAPTGKRSSRISLTTSPVVARPWTMHVCAVLVPSVQLSTGKNLLDMG